MLKTYSILKSRQVESDQFCWGVRAIKSIYLSIYLFHLSINLYLSIPLYFLRVTKLLVKIFQLEFLVIKEQNILVNFFPEIFTALTTLILDPFIFKNPSTIFSQKNRLSKFEGFCAAVSSCKKSEKYHFGLILAPFCPKISKQAFFLKKKSLESILSLHTTVTSCKKKNWLHAFIFEKNRKT